MIKHPSLQGLSLRSGAVEAQAVGWLLAGDPALTEQEQPHTVMCRIQGSAVQRTNLRFNAHSCCLISKPEAGFVAISTTGQFVVQTATGLSEGNIHQDSFPPPTRPLYGDFRKVVEIGGFAHAVGHEGMVYRLDEIARWTRIDEGLPDTFNAEGAHGYDIADVYAAGFRGSLWTFDGTNWRSISLPTNAILSVVRCIQGGMTYLGGHNGALLVGRDTTWSVIETDDVDDIWGLAWFAGELYVSTLDYLYVLRDGALTIVPLPDDAGAQASTYQLSVTDQAIWSVGEHDLFSFDAGGWSRVV